MPNTATGFPADSPKVYGWPAALVPSQLTMHLVPNSTAFESPFTGVIQAENLDGTSWQLSASFSGLGADEMKVAKAIITRLRGCAGRFYFCANPGATPSAQPSAFNPGRVAVGGPRFVSVEAGLLHSQGWDAAAGELIARAGDYISLDDNKNHRHLFLLLNDCYASEDGRGSFELFPEPIGFIIPEGAAIDRENASGMFLLVDDEQGAVTETPGAIGSFSISAVEFKPAKVWKVGAA